MQPWVLNETKTADFGDQRLHRRFEVLLERLGDKPSLSIPAACSGTAETEAAYRFFDNQRVGSQEVLTPHQDATLQRIRQEAVVLIPQDTTELDLTRRQEQVGGPLNDESRWGLFAHPLLAVTPECLPLGVIGATIWCRDAREFAKTPAQKRRQRKARPIEKKESFRWLNGYRRACEVAEQSPGTTVVSISDSEGDIDDSPGSPPTSERTSTGGRPTCGMDRAGLPGSGTGEGGSGSAAAVIVYAGVGDTDDPGQSAERLDR